jgi:hypothetical protein
MRNTEKTSTDIVKSLRKELQEANETIAALRSSIITSLTLKDKELAATREKLRIAVNILRSCGFGEDALDRYS